jgi:general secretion pathway protein J
MLGLTQGVRSGFSLWAAQTRRSAQTAELDATARVLRGLLTAIPITAAAAPGRGTAASIGFEGRADRLAFIGDLPTGFGDSRRADIAIALRGGRVVLAWAPHRHEASIGVAATPAEVELIRGVENLEFAYWGDPAGGSAAAWVVQWDGPALPQLIRIRLGFGKGDGRHWPDLVAAPQLWSSAG